MPKNQDEAQASQANHQERLRLSLTFAVLSTLLLVALPLAHAQTEVVLYNFCSKPDCVDGANPSSSLTPAGAGNFYGTTQLGGANGYGTVFELSPNGTGGYNESVLYSFCSLPNCTDGSSPTYSNVAFDSVGNLYGTTYYGGPHASGPYSGYGVVFELTPERGGGCPSGSQSGNGWCETILHSFSSNPDGAFPVSGLTSDSLGNLYGMTFGGGNGSGAVYELSPDTIGGWNEQVLYNRGGYSGLTIDSADNLYGADDVDDGHIFKLSRNGSGSWDPTILHTFNGGANDAARPQGTPFLDSAGNIYGTSEAGGSHSAGTVWKLTPVAGGEYTAQVLHSFIWSDGSVPYAGVVLDSPGNIYSTTGIGVKSPCYDGCGTVFELGVSGSTYNWRILLSFNGTDGAYPSDTLILNGSNLYGTTYGGGTSSGCGTGGCGVAFELSVPPASLSPTGAAFANQLVQTTSVAKTFTLTNNLSTALKITGIAFTGADPGDFAQTNTCGGSVASQGNCTISVTFTPTAAGSRTATLSITDPAKNGPQTALLTGLGTSSTTSTSLTSSANPAFVGQSVTFSASVTSQNGTVPTGTIAFANRATVLATVPLVGNSATYTTTFSKAATFSISAIYSGDACCRPSSKTMSETVQRYTTKTSLTGTPSPSIYGRSVTLTATVAASAPSGSTGTVIFKNGTTILGSAVLASVSATLTRTNLPVGANSLTATYDGDTYNAGSTSAVVVQNVTPARLSMKLSSTPNPSKLGQSIRFTATLYSNGSLPVGSLVTFTYSGGTLGTAKVTASGTAAFSTNAMPHGSNLVTASFAGNSNYGGASATTIQNVN
jgi:uncharacterized repeat protein (TIGR03803 family)